MKNKAASVGYTMNRSARPLSAIRVKPAAGNPRRGWLTAGSLTIPVALGRGGILANKREGDGGTPGAVSVPGNCGGGATGTAGRRVSCRPGSSPEPTPGVRIPATAITIREFGAARGRAVTGSSAPTISMTSSSKSTTTRDRGSPAVAARYFCTLPATISVRPRAASR